LPGDRANVPITNKETESMKLDRIRTPALAATAVLLIAGVGNAFAQTPTTAPTAPTEAPAASEVPGAPEAPSASEAPELPGAAEAPGAASDGPGGHEDPAGQTVDHQFEGVE
jgi:hypothetical protein